MNAILRVSKGNICNFDSRKCGEAWDPTGVIGAGLNFIGGLISNNTNKKLVRETNAQNLEMFNRQMQVQQDQFASSQQYQYDEWMRNREATLADRAHAEAYNDPGAQIERYRAAGLNPYLMMQGQNAAIGSIPSSAGGSSPSPGGIPAAAQLQTPRDGFGDTVAAATDAYLRARSTESEANLKDVQAEQLSIDNQTREKMNLVQLYNLKADLEEKRDKLKTNKKQRDYLDRQIDLLDDQIAVNFASFDARVKQMEIQNYATMMSANKMNEESQILQIQKQFAWRMENAKLKLTEMQSRGIAQDIVESGSRINLNNANASKAAAEEAESIARKHGLPSQNTPAGKLARDYIKSQIFNNYQREHLGGDWIYNPSTGLMEAIPKDANPLINR